MRAFCVILCDVRKLRDWLVEETVRSELVSAISPTNGFRIGICPKAVRLIGQSGHRAVRILLQSLSLVMVLVGLIQEQRSKDAHAYSSSLRQRDVWTSARTKMSAEPCNVALPGL
jgi:hypothetical protein